MLTSEERLVVNRDSWFKVPTYGGGMLQADEKSPTTLENEGNFQVHEFLSGGVKEELQLEVVKEEDSLDTQNDRSCPSSSEGLLTSNFIKVELSDSEDPTDEDFEKCQKFQEERIKQSYSLLYPGCLLNLDRNLEFQPHWKATHNTEPLVQQIKKGKVSKYVSFQFQINPWEILRKREKNRVRRALERSLETEEQRKARLEKDRLAKASRRAGESLEKKMRRREKDRIAKARLRAAETEEQRQIRREKNRIAMAALRASQTEEERLIRRERDRIKKAKMRAFETEEQKRIRREKNRIAMAMRRAKLSEKERNYRRNVNRLAQAASRSRLRAEKRSLAMMKGKRVRKSEKTTENDPLELPYFGSFFNRIGNQQENIKELESGSVEDEENLDRTTDFEMIHLKSEFGLWNDEIASKFLPENPSTSNQSTTICGPSTH